MNNLEIQRVANGWMVGPARGLVNDYRPWNPEENWFVFNNWADLVRHIKKELALPKKTE